jgi:hypothetical protein
VARLKTREFQNTQSLGLRFRAVLTEGGPPVHFHCEGFNLLGENSGPGCDDASGIVGEGAALAAPKRVMIGERVLAGSLVRTEKELKGDV